MIGGLGDHVDEVELDGLVRLDCGGKRDNWWQMFPCSPVQLLTIRGRFDELGAALVF